VRQAHRVGARAAGHHVAPGLVAGGLLVAAFLSTAMVAGSTAGGPATRGHSVESTIGRSAAAALPMKIASAGFEEQASIEMSGDVLRSTAPARRPTVLTLAAGRVAPVPVGLPAEYNPSPSPRPTATARPAATATPTAARAKAVPPPSPKATQKPATKSRTVSKVTPVKATPVKATPVKATPVRPPTPAIVYRYRASGRATWGPFGGAVITRLPPGTQIRVCGRLGCWQGVSSGHGPSADGGNLVDLSSEVFRRVCGPLGVGVGSIVLSWR
jgi:hypothetical protein